MGKRLSTPVTNSVTEQPHSRYVQGGTTDVYAKRTGWWERIELPLDDLDIAYTITPRTANRPDLVASDVYGSSRLMWAVLQYNNIVDITTEFVAGTVLRLPTPRRLNLDILSKPATGGNRVT